MRYTETISIPWHTFAGEKPCPNRDVVVKLHGANALFAPKDILFTQRTFHRHLRGMAAMTNGRMRTKRGKTACKNLSIPNPVFAKVETYDALLQT